MRWWAMWVADALIWDLRPATPVQVVSLLLPACPMRNSQLGREDKRGERLRCNEFIRSIDRWRAEKRRGTLSSS